MRIVNNNELEMEWKSTGTPKEGVSHYWVARGRVCGPTTTVKNFKEGIFWAIAPKINVPPEALMKDTLTKLEFQLVLEHAHTLADALPEKTARDVLNIVLGNSMLVVTVQLFEALEAKLIDEKKARVEGA